MTRFATISSAFLLLTTTPARADEDVDVQVLPCRPTIACTAEIVPERTLELETGFAQRRATGATVNSVQALLKYSITDRVQVQLGTNNIVVSQTGMSTHAIDGVYFGPKVVLVEQTAHAPAIAVSALVMTPTSSDADAATHTTDAYLWAYASKDFLTLHADFNVGVNVISIDDKPAAQRVVALSMSRDIAWGIGAMAEGYAFTGGAPYVTHDAGFLAALSYSVAPRVMFDIGTDVALFRDARDITLFTGVTIAAYQRR